MVTRKQIKKALDDNTESFKLLKNIDHDLYALSLLREKIPYDKYNSIIQGAEHDQIFLCDVDDALPYLTIEDLKILADCNMFIDEDHDCLSLFV